MSELQAIGLLVMSPLVLWVFVIGWMFVLQTLLENEGVFLAFLVLAAPFVAFSIALILWG